MKKTGIILGALLLAAGLTGCGGEKKEEAAKAPEKLRIGFTAYKYDDNFILFQLLLIQLYSII